MILCIITWYNLVCHFDKIRPYACIIMARYKLLHHDNIQPFSSSWQDTTLSTIVTLKQWCRTYYWYLRFTTVLVCEKSSFIFTHSLLELYDFWQRCQREMKIKSTSSSSYVCFELTTGIRSCATGCSLH